MNNKKVGIVVVRRHNRKFVPLPADSPELKDPRKVAGVVKSKPTTPKKAGKAAALLNQLQGLDNNDE